MKPPPTDEWFTVVGVVEEVRLGTLVDGSAFRTVGAYYLPVAQHFARTLGLAVRTSQEPSSLISALRGELAAIDPELPLYNVRTMTERISLSVVDRRTPMVLALGFAGIALLLAAIGIYGVLAYQVGQRSREIGIRMALGAKTSSIFRMVLAEGATMVGVGAVIGLGGAVAAGRAIQSLLYDVGPMEPAVLAAVAGLLFVAALTATLLPARRAASTDPVHALTGQ